MAQYVYVQAVEVRADRGLSDGLLISFRGTTVQAEDDREAYHAGWAWAETQPSCGVTVYNDFVMLVEATCGCN